MVHDDPVVVLRKCRRRWNAQAKLGCHHGQPCPESQGNGSSEKWLARWCCWNMETYPTQIPGTSSVQSQKWFIVTMAWETGWVSGMGRPSGVGATSALKVQRLEGRDGFGWYRRAAGNLKKKLGLYLFIEQGESGPAQCIYYLWPGVAKWPRVANHDVAHSSFTHFLHTMILKDD